jgi:hypothetical protein
MKPKQMTTPPVRNSISRSPLRHGFLLIALAWFALSPTARAVSPAPDGGYANDNTAEGTNALNSLTTGKSNTANGFEALFSNSSGNNNTATGVNALFSNNGTNNTATGLNSLHRNTSGGANTATGAGALFFNTMGNDNTADGFQALEQNTTGALNTASGYEALFSNTTGISNTAIGVSALFKNKTGGSNTAVGDNALLNNTGNENIALGDFAGENLTTGSNNIDIGNQGVALDAFTMRLGAAQNVTYIAGIYGINEGGTISNVYINSNGQLGTQPPPSSRRFKKEIRPMDKASEAILGLKPVTFQYKSDNNATAQFGLIAEEVEKVNPDLVLRDEKGQVYTVRYEAVNAMLLNEFLKEHCKVEELETTVAQLTVSLKEQASKIQKVNQRLDQTPLLPLQADNH